MTWAEPVLALDVGSAEPLPTEFAIPVIVGLLILIVATPIMQIRRMRRNLAKQGKPASWRPLALGSAIGVAIAVVAFALGAPPYAVQVGLIAVVSVGALIGWLHLRS